MYIWKGKEYNSMQKLAQALGVSFSFIQRRRKKGLSVDEIISQAEEFLAERSKKVVDHLGNEYNSKREMCDSYSIDADLFKSRIRAGWNLEDALTLLPYGKSSHGGSIVINGEYFTSYRQVSRRFGIGVKAISSRGKRGYSHEKLIEDVITRKRLPVVYNGVEYGNLGVLAKSLGLTYHLLYHRVKRLGRCIDDVVEEMLNE